MEHRTLGQDRPQGLGRRTRHLAARRRLGRRHRGRRAAPCSRRRVEAGVTFFDTADVYGDGRSEQIIGRFLAAHPDAGITVATKMGRRVDQVPENYVARELPRLDRPVAPQPRRRHASTWCSCTARRARSSTTTRRTTPSTRSSTRASSPPTASASRPCDQALTAIARPARRQRADHPQRLPAQAARRGAARGRATAGVGIIARVPLASGLLSGQVRRSTPRSPRTTTATTTATAAPSTSARPSPASTTRPASRRRGSSPRSSRRRARRLTPAQAALAWVVAAAGRHHGDPGRPQRRRRRGPTPPPATVGQLPAGVPRRRARPLRPADPRAGPRPLVTPAPSSLAQSFMTDRAHPGVDAYLAQLPEWQQVHL